MIRVYLFLILAVFLVVPNIAQAGENPCGRFAVSLDLKYEIQNGTVNSLCHDQEANGILISIDSINTGTINLEIPRKIMNPVLHNCQDDSFFVLLDGQETIYKETKTIHSRTLIIQFDNESSEIEIIGSMTPEGVRYEKICKEKIILSPQKQIVNGVLPEDVVCNDGLVLIKKLSKDTVACVKPTTAEKLVQRGWGTTTLIETQETMKSIKVSNTDFTINYTITGGNIIEAVADVEVGAMILSLQTTNDGEIAILMPLVEAVAGCQSYDKDYFVLVNGYETPYNVTTTDSNRTLTFEFQKGTDEIEIVKTAFCKGMPGAVSIFTK